MTDDLLLDTHVALWLDKGEQRLDPVVARRIEDHWLFGGRVFLSAVTAWEIAQLHDKGRLLLPIDLIAWINRFIGRPGVEALPLDHKAAVAAYQLPDYPYRDPGDRLLMGTAIVQGCPLVTFDGRILSYAEQHGEAVGLRVLGHDARH